MKKSLLLLIIISHFLIFNSFSQSPNWLWAKAMAGTGDNRGFCIAVDASGNVYTTGFFFGTVDFDPGLVTFNLTSTGEGDIFISKFDVSGNFVWAKKMGGTGWDTGQSIVIDPSGSGDVYTTGDFLGTVDFDPGAGVFNLISTGQDDIFISKLDNSGNFIWAKQMGGIGGEIGVSIAVDPTGSGALYSTGWFTSTADFDPGVGVFNLTSNGSPEIFISKLDSSGNFIWAKQFGGTIGDVGNSIAIDTSGIGDVYTTGMFQGSADFDPGPGVFNLTSAGYMDIFISKLDSSGNFVWAKTIGGTNYDVGHSIAIDPAGSGDVYTTGVFEGTVDFDPDTSVGNVFSLTSFSIFSDDIFISKLDSSGNFVWAKQMGGSGDDYGLSIALDPTGSGDIYTSGYFNGTTDYDPGAGVFNLTSAGGYDIFISKLDSTGSFLWAKAAGGVNYDVGQAMTLNTSGNVYITGDFESPSITFGSTTITNTGNRDIFIAKVDTSVVTEVHDVSGLLNKTDIFPNPFSGSTVISFSLSQSEKVSIKIFDVSGRLVATLADKIFEAGKNEITWEAKEINSGIYFLQIQTAQIIKTEKLIVTN